MIGTTSRLGDGWLPMKFEHSLYEGHPERQLVMERLQLLYTVSEPAKAPRMTSGSIEFFAELLQNAEN